MVDAAIRRLKECHTSAGPDLAGFNLCRGNAGGYDNRLNRELPDREHRAEYEQRVDHGLENGAILIFVFRFHYQLVSGFHVRGFHRLPRPIAPRVPRDSRSSEAAHPLVIRIRGKKFCPAESFRAWETPVPKMERTFCPQYLPLVAAAFFDLRSPALAWSRSFFDLRALLSGSSSTAKAASTHSR